MRYVPYFALALVALTGFSLLPGDAWALTCGAGGSASGDIYGLPPECSGPLGLQNIFSRVFCDFVTIVNKIMGDTYCSIQFTIEGTVNALITLYLAVFGAQILMGTVQMTVKEIMVRLLKLAGVWTFITQTYWAIGLAFNFFVSTAVYGSVWVWGGLDVNAAVHNPNNIPVATSGSLMDVFAFFDQVVYQAVTGPFTVAHSELIGFFFVMWYLIPTLFMLAAYWLWINFTILLRALISFLICVSALAFLLVLSPIFMSFLLFGTTYHLFENWLKYMMSYSIQVIVIFACIGMWLAAIHMFAGFFDELANVLFTYDSLWVDSAAKSDPTSTWGICPFDITVDPLGPHAACTNPSFDPVANPSDRQLLIPAARIAQQGEFVYFIVYRLLTLIIICYAFDTLVRQAPQIAKSLAGPEYVPILGQGYGYSKYGEISKGTPSWTKKHNASIIKNIDKTLGISKTAKNAMDAVSNKYTDSLRSMITRR